MKAIGFKKSLLIDKKESLFEFDAPMPTLGEFDVLVKVQAVSVNPVDAKNRMRTAPDTELDEPKVLGYDAVGLIEKIGSRVQGFSSGDKVYYAGDITRQGSNAEFQAVDSRIIAHSPKSLSDVEAAVLPLTALTAWEAFFDRMYIDKEETGKSILIIGGAGGVSSIAIQLAKQLTNLTIIATASRPESTEWVKKLGADYVVNHYDLVNSVRELGFESVDYIFNTSVVKEHWDAKVELIAPFGNICAIVGSPDAFPLGQLMGKAISFSWELMFTRPRFKTKDMDRQGKILEQVAKLVDEGKLKTTLTNTLNGLSVDSIKEAHRLIESGKSIGKTGIFY